MQMQDRGLKISKAPKTMMRLRAGENKLLATSGPILYNLGFCKSVSYRIVSIEFALIGPMSICLLDLSNE